MHHGEDRDPIRRDAVDDPVRPLQQLADVLAPILGTSRPLKAAVSSWRVRVSNRATISLALAGESWAI